eukprot:3187688-Pyramimonas_sp.AAC.1
MVRMCRYTTASYLLQQDVDKPGKWTSIVNAGNCDTHAAIAKQIFDYIIQNKSTKGKAVAMKCKLVEKSRNKTSRAIRKKKSAVVTDSHEEPHEESEPEGAA